MPEIAGSVHGLRRLWRWHHSAAIAARERTAKWRTAIWALVLGVVAERHVGGVAALGATLPHLIVGASTFFTYYHVCVSLVAKLLKV